MMQCPMCQRENYETGKPCPQCGFEGDVNLLFGKPEPDLPAFLTPEEEKKAWIELAQFEELFEKVDEWRNAGYFRKELESLDPVEAQRARANELRQRLEEYPRPELFQTEQDRLRLVDFLMDNIDLLASRQWFKSKKKLEKAVIPIIVMMLDAISGNEPE